MNVFIVLGLCSMGLLVLGLIVCIQFFVLFSGDVFLGLRLSFLMFGSFIGSLFFGMGMICLFFVCSIGIGVFQKC